MDDNQPKTIREELDFIRQRMLYAEGETAALRMIASISIGFWSESKGKDALLEKILPASAIMREQLLTVEGNPMEAHAAYRGFDQAINDLKEMLSEHF